MSRLSEQVQNQLKVSEKVVMSARTHATQIAQALSGKFAKVPEDIKIDTKLCESVILAMAWGLENAAGDLRQRELDYAAEQADDAPVRKARDSAVEQAIALMSGLRATVDNVLGREALSTYGLLGETVRVPSKLLNHMQNVAQLLKKSPLTAKAPFGVSFGTAEAATSIEALHQQLEGLIKDDNREVRELEDALVKRNRAADAWVEAYQGTATALEGLYRLAGWKELADRVRPTQRTIRGEDPGPEMERGVEEASKG
jgi:hypothetical protein